MEQTHEQGSADMSPLIKKLDLKQRKALELFAYSEHITSSQIAQLFGYKQRTAALLCATWTSQGFLTVLDSSNKGRKYGLAKRYKKLV